MECTTSRTIAAGMDLTALDLSSLLSRLTTLTDVRCPRGLRYDLAPLLLLIVLAKLSGEDSLSGVADWVKSRGWALRQALSLSWPAMPHHNTYRRILEEVVTPEELDQMVGEHLRSLPGVGHSVLIVIDGKTVRGTIDATSSVGEHLLAAYMPEEGVVLMQVAAGTRENEITVAPKLVRYLDLRGKVVAGDAIHTQRPLSVQILKAGGEYLWLVKDNQPKLRQDIDYLFNADDRTVEGGHITNDFQTWCTVDKGHGRRERREITVSGELKGYSDWPGVEQVFKVDRCRVDLRSGKEERETVYGLTSLSPKEASPERLLSLTRSIWGIENGLHYRRDVTFGEDRTRLTRGQAGRVMASLNNLVIGLLRHTGATNIAAARRWCDATFTLTLASLPAGLLT
jgi:predicted transposase YbfD/YdcC